MLQFIRPCVFLLWETLWNFNPTENDSRTMHLKIRYYNLSLPSTVIFLISASDLLPDFLNTGFVSALRTCCCVTGWNVSVSVCTPWHTINLHGTQFEVTWHGTNLLRWTEGSNESGSLFVSLPSPCWWCWVVAGAGARCWHIVNKSWRRSSPSVCRAVTHQPDLGTDIRNPPTLQKKVGMGGTITEGGYNSVFSSCVMRWNEEMKMKQMTDSKSEKQGHFAIKIWPPRISIL